MMLLNVFDVGVNVTFTGVVIVFGMLIILVCVLSVFGIVSKINTKRQAKKSTAQITRSVELKENSVEKPVLVSNHTTNSEIIAVISAAVASMYSKSTKKPVIKSIKRSASVRSAWANAGIIDNTRAF